MACPPFLLFNKLWEWGLCRLIGSYCTHVFSHRCVMFNTWIDYLRLLAYLCRVWCSRTIEIRFKKSVLCQLLASFFPGSSSWLDMTTCLCMQWSPHVFPPILCFSFWSSSLLGLRFLCVCVGSRSVEFDLCGFLLLGLMTLGFLYGLTLYMGFHCFSVYWSVVRLSSNFSDFYSVIRWTYWV